MSMEIHGTRASRRGARMHWLASASAAVAIMMIIWLALFSGLMRWQPGLRIAQGPSIAAERAFDAGEGAATKRIEKLSR